MGITVFRRACHWSLSSARVSSGLSIKILYAFLISHFLLLKSKDKKMSWKLGASRTGEANSTR